MVIIKQPPGVLTNDQKKINFQKLFPFREPLSLTVFQGQDTVNRLQCPERWTRFGNSCYILSDFQLTPIQVGNMCHQYYFDNSHLMHVRNPLELFYAAHVLIKSKLNKILFKVDPNLMKGKK